MDFTLQAHGTNVYWALNFCGSLKGSKSTLDASARYNALCKRFTEHRLIEFCMVEEMDSEFQPYDSVSTLHYDKSFTNLYYFSTKYPAGVKLNPVDRNMKQDAF